MSQSAVKQLKHFGAFFIAKKKILALQWGNGAAVARNVTSQQEGCRFDSYSDLSVGSFEYSPCACAGSFQVLQHPPTVKRQAW